MTFLKKYITTLNNLGLQWKNSFITLKSCEKKNLTILKLCLKK